MRKRWKWVTAVLLLLGVLACLITAGRGPEPRYRGRSLGQWLQRYGDPDRKEEATDAIICIVTNHGSELVRLLDYDPGPRWNRQISRIQNIPKFLYPAKFLYAWMFMKDKQEVRSSDALSAFEIAGAHAEGAVPALTSLMLTNTSERAAMNAASALASVGGPGRLALQMNATNRESPARLYALQALPAAWGYPEEARKVIFAALTDPNPRVRETATNTARRYWPEYRGYEF